MERLRTIIRIIKVDENGDLLEAKILKKLSHPAIVDVIEVLNMPVSNFFEFKNSVISALDFFTPTIAIKQSAILFL